MERGPGPRTAVVGSHGDRLEMMASSQVGPFRRPYYRVRQQDGVGKVDLGCCECVWFVEEYSVRVLPRSSMTVVH